MQLFTVLKYTDFVLWMMFSLYNDPYKHGISVSLAFEFVVMYILKESMLY